MLPPCVLLEAAVASPLLHPPPPPPTTNTTFDAAGQERFRTISMSFLRGAQGIALVFDLTERKTFDSVRAWSRQVADSTDGGVPMVLIANKADLREKWVVSEDEVAELARSLHAPVFFTSAKTGDNVAPAFEALARASMAAVMATKAKRPAAGGDGADVPAVDLGATGGKKPAGGCCG